MTTLDLRDVRAFLAVCQYGTFTAAASALYTTQPSLSRRIARLEQQVGGVLFDRRSRRAPRLALLGVRLLPQARQLMAEHERLAEVARLHTQASRGTVTVAVSDIAAELVLPTLFRCVAERFPGLKLIIVQRLPGPPVREALADGTAELAFVADTYMLPEFQSVTFGTVPDVAVGSPRMLEATKDAIEWDELRKMPLLLPVSAEDVVFPARRPEPQQVVHQSGSPGVLRGLAHADAGVMITGGLRGHRDLVCRPIAVDGVLQRRRLELAWVDPAGLGPTAKRLVGELQASLTDRDPAVLENGVVADIWDRSVVA
jgi:DNA-binding transcriptional LysR family regulator